MGLRNAKLTMAVLVFTVYWQENTILSPYLWIFVGFDPPTLVLLTWLRSF
jgi:hypothetical protein